MSSRRGRNLLDHIGGTPLLQLQKIEIPDRVNLFVNAEWFNPSGSIRDRSISGIIDHGEKKGDFGGDSSVNTIQFGREMALRKIVE